MDQPDGPTPDQPQPPRWPAPPIQGEAAPGTVHPLSIGRAISLAGSIFRSRWRPLLAVLAVLLVPAYAVQAALTALTGGIFDEWLAAVGEWSTAPLPELADLPPFPIDVFLLSIVVGLLTAVAALIAGAAAVYIVGWTYGGGSPGPRRALAQAGRRHLADLIAASLVVLLTFILVTLGGLVLIGLLLAAANFQAGPTALLAVIASVALFVTLVFIALRWTFFVNAIMLEGHGGTGALGRSWRLVAGSTWRVLGYALLVGLLFLVLILLVAIVLLGAFGLGVDPRTGVPEPFNPVRAIAEIGLTGVVGMLFTPFYTAFMTLLYYDLRWRRGELIGPPPG